MCDSRTMLIISSTSFRLGRRWCSFHNLSLSATADRLTFLNGCADQLVSGSLCHIWCRRKELAAGDVCSAPSVYSSFLRAAVVNASSANFAPCLTVCLQDIGDHQRCFPMNNYKCCIAHVSLADILAAQFGVTSML